MSRYKQVLQQTCPCSSGKAPELVHTDGQRKPVQSLCKVRPFSASLVAVYHLATVRAGINQNVLPVSLLAVMY